MLPPEKNGEVPDVFFVTLKERKKGRKDIILIRLLCLCHNLYIIGYQTKGKWRISRKYLNVYYAKLGGTYHKTKSKREAEEDRITFPYDVGYVNLERFSGVERENMDLGKAAMSEAMEKLFNYHTKLEEDKSQAAKDEA
ncbi:hypothetical protein Tsubulata_050704, partial [Turnera subulata]